MKESVSLTWRRIPERYRILGTVCKNCDAYFFPLRQVCPKCRRKGRIEPHKFSGRGTVYSFTEIHSGPAGFESQVPYVMAIVELEEGPRCTGQVVDAKLEDVKIGDPVEAVFRQIQVDGDEGLIHYGFKFRKVKQ